MDFHCDGAEARRQLPGARFPCQPAEGQPTLADGPEEAGDDLTNQLLPRAAAIADAERRTSDAAADPGAGKRPARRTAKGFRARLPAGSSNPALASFFALRLMHSQRQMRMAGSSTSCLTSAKTNWTSCQCEL
jgi:hypothetical protein